MVRSLREYLIGTFLHNPPIFHAVKGFGRGIVIAPHPDFSIRWLRESVNDGFWIAADHHQQHSCRAIGYPATLLPALDRPRVQPETIRDFLPAQLHALSQRNIPPAGGIVHDPASQLPLPSPSAASILRPVSVCVPSSSCLSLLHDACRQLRHSIAVRRRARSLRSAFA